MRYALLLDTETSGLDPKKDRVVEVAVCRYDLREASPIESFSSLIQGDRNEAADINRIPVTMLAAAPADEGVWDRVFRLVQCCDAIIAHRAEFDRAFVPESLRKVKPWVCSKFHIEWPAGKVGDGLVAMALAHGLGVASAHRAATDVDTLARMLTRAHEMLSGDVPHYEEHKVAPLQDLVLRAMRPRKKVQAIVSYEDRDKAKSAGFAWEPATKRWLAELFEDKIAALPFPTRAA